MRSLLDNFLKDKVDFKFESRLLAKHDTLKAARAAWDAMGVLRDEELNEATD